MNECKGNWPDFFFIIVMVRGVAGVMTDTCQQGVACFESPNGAKGGRTWDFLSLCPELRHRGKNEEGSLKADSKHKKKKSDLLLQLPTNQDTYNFTSDHIKCWQKTYHSSASSCNVNSNNHSCKRVRQFLQKILHIQLPHNSAVALLGIHPREMKNYFHIKTCMPL